MQPETGSSPSKEVDLCINKEDSEGFLENLANANLSAKEIQEKIAQMAEALASKNWRTAEAEGKPELTKQANNLRGLARTIRGLKPPTP